MQAKYLSILACLWWTKNRGGSHLVSTPTALLTHTHTWCQSVMGNLISWLWLVLIAMRLDQMIKHKIRKGPWNFAFPFLMKPSLIHRVTKWRFWKRAFSKLIISVDKRRKAPNSGFIVSSLKEKMCLNANFYGPTSLAIGIPAELPKKPWKTGTEPKEDLSRLVLKARKGAEKRERKRKDKTRNVSREILTVGGNRKKTKLCEQCRPEIIVGPFFAWSGYKNMI